MKPKTLPHQCAVPWFPQGIKLPSPVAQHPDPLAGVEEVIKSSSE